MHCRERDKGRRKKQMEKNKFGRTELSVSRLTFGCGAVGGLMTKGNSADQDRAVAWARDNGINFFDTAASYGNGLSETNLGRALGSNRDGIIISTKIGITTEQMASLETTLRSSLETSLTRLKQSHVDLFQLHNTVSYHDTRGYLSAEHILEQIVPVFEKLRTEGKTRFIGFTAKGNAEDLHKLVKSGQFDSAQVFFNLLSPSAGGNMPAGYPAANYHGLLDATENFGVGSIGVRALAGGALSGSKNRHPLGTPTVTPIGSASTYSTDILHARRFLPLIDTGHAENLPELALRYVISNRKLSTMEIGISTLEEIQQAAISVNKGPLPAQTLEEIWKIQNSIAIMV